MFKNCVFKTNVDTLEWIKKAGIRAIKTVAQTAVAMLPVAGAINQVDWKMVVSCALLSGIISVLTSIGGIPEVEAK